MKEQLENSVGEITENQEEVSMYIGFSKPYLFEGDTYEGVDLSGLETLNTKDLIDIEKRFYRLNVASFNPENTVSYAEMVAQKATEMPIEFFEQLPMKEMLKIKNRIVSFFYS